VSVFPEAVLEFPRNGLQVSHTTSSSGLSPLSLLTPLIRPDLSGRISTAGAGFVLLVESTIAAATAKSVGFGMSLTERGSSLVGVWTR